MRDYMNVIFTTMDGKREWSGQMIAVPKIGDAVSVRDDRSGVREWGGQVEDVVWTLAIGRLGVVITVWVKEEEPEEVAIACRDGDEIRAEMVKGDFPVWKISRLARRLEELYNNNDPKEDKDISGYILDYIEKVEDQLELLKQRIRQ